MTLPTFLQRYIAIGLLVFLGAAAGRAQTASTILTPEPGSTFSSAGVTFTWADVGAENYILFVGTSGAGSSNIHNSSIITATSRAVSGVPTNQVVYVRLWTKVNGTANSYFIRDYIYNIDTDNDGIRDTLDDDPATPAPKTVRVGSNYTLTLLGSGRVASLQIDAATWDNHANGIAFADARVLSRMIYEQMYDVFDFIIFTHNQDSSPPGSAYSGVHFSVRNTTQGIGRSLFDNSASFGSAGELEGVMHLIRRGMIRGGPSLHEIMHRWANALASVPTAAGGHWGYSSINGQLGGWDHSTFQDLGGGNYQVDPFGSVANGGNGLPFSDFELYLMGMIPPTGLADIHIANDFAWIDSGAGTFSASSIDTVTLNDVIATDGARIPDSTTAQKHFKVLHVILTKTPVANGTWAAVDEETYNFDIDGSDGQSAYNFWEATGGRGTLEMDGLPNALRPEVDIDRIDRVGAQLEDREITFPTESGETYFVQRGSGPLPVSTWNTLASGLAGTGNPVAWTDTAATGDQGFYRVGRGAPPAAIPQAAPVSAHAGEPPGGACPCGGRGLPLPEKIMVYPGN